MDPDVRTPPATPLPTARNAAGANSRPRWLAPAAIGAAAAAGTAAIALVDPTDSGVPVCASQSLFGVDCPLCGGLRCVGSLARGDLLAAADHNVLLALALPVVVVAWALWMFRSLRDRPFRLPTLPSGLIGTLAVLTLAFTVLRNIDGAPAIEWLASTRSG